MAAQPNPTVGYLATANDFFTLGAAGAGAYLYSINVDTAAASAVVTVYRGTSTSGTVVATLDASSKSTSHFYGSFFGSGLFVKLTGGNAKVSVVAG